MIFKQEYLCQHKSIVKVLEFHQNELVISLP